jgi:hypothetical protein
VYAVVALVLHCCRAVVTLKPGTHRDELAINTAEKRNKDLKKREQDPDSIKESG